MKVTITIPDSKYPIVENILKGLQSLVGKEFEMSAEALKPAEGAAIKRRRNPSKKERLAEADKKIFQTSWRKPRDIKKP